MSESNTDIFGRFRTGLMLTKDSAGVIMDHPRLLVFPLLAAASSIVFFILLFFPLVVANVVGGGLEYLFLFALYFATTFVSTFFTAALVHAANETFHGREPSIGDSIRAVAGKVDAIAIWSAVAATVSILLRILENSNNPLAAILRSVFAVGWSVLTFFIIPVLVFEDVTATSMFKRSGAAFRDTWGETIGTGFGVTGVVIAVGAVLVVAAVLVSVPVAAVFPGLGLLLTVMLVVLAVTFSYLLSQTIWGVAKAALYVYSQEGIVPSQFENFDFETLGGRAEQTANVGQTPADAASQLTDD